MKGKVLSALAVGAMIFGGAVSGASAAETAAQVKSSLGLGFNAATGGFTSTIASVTTFWNTVKTDATMTNGWAAITSAFENVSGLSSSDLFDGDNLTIGPLNGKKASWSGVLDFDPTTSTISFSSFSSGSLKSGVSVMASTKVPGPVAGVGLPVIASLVGFFLLRRSREQAL